MTCMDATRAHSRSKHAAATVFDVVPPIMSHAILILAWAMTLVWEVARGRSGISLPWELGLVLYCTWTGAARFGLAAAAVAAILRWTVLRASAADLAGFWLLELATIWWVDRLRTQFWDVHQRARRDPLTDLPNRRAMEEFLDAEISRATRFTRPLVVAMLDCDGFKQLNDESGHLAGDAALRQIGELLKREVRGYDGVFRLGGDEFVIVLPETGQTEAEFVCERLRTAFAHDIERTLPGLTACLGVAVFTSPPADVAECLQRADEIMYRAKRAGPGETVIEAIDALPRTGPPRMMIAE